MTTARWGDLGLRVASALVLAAVGVLALWIGPMGFAALVAAVTALMCWELLGLHGSRSGVTPTVTLVLGIGLALFLLTAPGLSVARIGDRPILLLPVACVLAMSLAVSVRREQALAFAAGLVVICAGGVLVGVFSQAPGLVLLVVLVVIATDVGGYFAGRLFGGPRVWPAVSPGKTWSGVIGGWGLAATVALVADIWLALPRGIVVWAILLSVSAQIGDFTESALKRHFGVKDASNLIPGHGGFLDRFDGVVGAAIALWVMTLVT